MTQAAMLQDQVVRMDAATVVLAEPAAAAKTALAAALAYCAEKMNLASPQAALGRVYSDQSARGYFQYGLARQVAVYLASLDDEVKAAYLYDSEATPEDVIFAELQAATPLHVIIRVGRKTRALSALTAALADALAKHEIREAALSAPVVVLDVHCVDDIEAQRGSGEGALLKSLYLPPILVWER